MDKQIIIDGVDVSGCSCHYNGWSQLYRDNRDMCDKGYDFECKPKENGCYHYTKCLEQQLKRKEQELQEAMDNYVKLDNQRVKEYNELVDKYNNKEQECEILKDEYKILENNLDSCTRDFEDVIDSYKQTLTEIKDIAESYNHYSAHAPVSGYSDILQKISEVVYEE